MSNWPILSLVTFLPLVGVLFILFIRGEPEVVARNARYVALWTSLITFVVSLSLWFGFERGTADFQFVEKADWMPGFNISYHMGVDGIGNWPILSLVTFLPLVGVLFILFIRGEPEVVARNARYVALWTSLITFVVSLSLWFGFERGTADFQFVEKADWMPGFNISYHMGVDGISVLFVLLSTLLTPLCIVASWDAIKIRVKEYMIAFLVLETLMVGMFCALDFVLFYVFFEGVLIPMFLIIGIWGGERRVYAAFKFFLYTLTGSVLLLLALLAMYLEAGTGQGIEEELEDRFPGA